MILKDIRNNEYDLSKWKGFQQHHDDPSTCAKIVIDEMNSDEIYGGIFNIHSREDMVVVDIGANVGLFTLFMYPVCSKIYSVEPTPNHLNLLRNMKDTYNLDKCEVMPLAISNANGKIKFNTNSGNSTMNSLIGPNTYNRETLTPHQLDSMSGYDGSVEVDTMSLNSFLEHNNINHVDFMKLDIEGGEQQVIYAEDFSNAASKIKSMYIEIHEGLGADKSGILKELGKYFANAFDMPYQANPGFYLTK